MRNNIFGNFSINILLFFLMMFFLMYSYKLCIPITFCMIFFCTIYGYNIVPAFVSFSLLFDAYIGNFLGITCCGFIVLYLQAHHYQYALKNAPTLYQGYYFLRMLINAECINIAITLILARHVSIGVFLLDFVKTIALFAGLKLISFLKRWWKYAKVQ